MAVGNWEPTVLTGGETHTCKNSLPGESAVQAVGLLGRPLRIEKGAGAVCVGSAASKIVPSDFHFSINLRWSPPILFTEFGLCCDEQSLAEVTVCDFPCLKMLSLGAICYKAMDN